jgi:hypothetical protein
MSEAAFNADSIPQEIRAEQARLTVVTTPDLFAIALESPIAEAQPLSNTEQYALKNLPVEAVAAHAITGILLRRAGDHTTIKQYQMMKDAENAYQNIQQKKTVKKDVREAAADTARESAELAAPYADMYKKVSPFNARYLRMYTAQPGVTQGELRARIEENILDPSQEFDHPALADIRGLSYLDDRRRIVIDRVMRMILLDDIDDL